jgi:hypothetical protein
VGELAQADKQALHQATYSSGTVMKEFLLCKTLEGDIEDLSFYGHGIYQNNSFLISNLGVFQPREDMVDGGWSVKEVGFSAGAVRATLSDVGTVFNVASVKGGSCVISIVYEEGVLKDEMVKMVVAALAARLKAVAAVPSL